MLILFCKSNFVYYVCKHPSHLCDNGRSLLSPRTEEVRVVVKKWEFLRWVDDFSSGLTVEGFSRPFSRSHDCARGRSVSCCCYKQGRKRPCCLQMTVWLICVTHSLLRPVQSNHREHLHNICSSACSRSASTSSTTWKRKFNWNNKTQCVDSSDCLLETANQIKEVNMSATIWKCWTEPTTSWWFLCSNQRWS